jgi:hypothetical protein
VHTYLVRWNLGGYRRGRGRALTDLLASIRLGAATPRIHGSRATSFATAYTLILAIYSRDIDTTSMAIPYIARSAKNLKGRADPRFP